MNQECVPCHAECRSCREAGPYECNGDCVHYVEDGRCVRLCSQSHYATDDSRCLPCDISCSNCTGPTSAHCSFCRQYTLFDDYPNRHSFGATVRTPCVIGQFISLLTLSTPAVPNCWCPKRLATYWSNPPFLIFDIRALWRSVLSARVSECQKLKMAG